MPLSRSQTLRKQRQLIEYNKALEHFHRKLDETRKAEQEEVVHRSTREAAGLVSDGEHHQLLSICLRFLVKRSFFIGLEIRMKCHERCAVLGKNRAWQRTFFANWRSFMMCLDLVFGWRDHSWLHTRWWFSPAPDRCTFSKHRFASSTSLPSKDSRFFVSFMFFSTFFQFSHFSFLSCLFIYFPNVFHFSITLSFLFHVFHLFISLPLLCFPFFFLLLDSCQDTFLAGSKNRFSTAIKSPKSNSSPFSVSRLLFQRFCSFYFISFHAFLFFFSFSL